MKYVLRATTLCILVLLLVPVTAFAQNGSAWLKGGYDPDGNVIVDLFVEGTSVTYGVAFDAVYDPAVLGAVDADGDGGNGVQPSVEETGVLSADGAVETLTRAALEDGAPGRVVVGHTRTQDAPGAVIGAATPVLSLFFSRLQEDSPALALENLTVVDDAGESVLVTTLPVVYGVMSGIVVIDATPDNAPWTLTDGLGQATNGAGDATLDVAMGDVTITWLPLEGYDLPDPATETTNLERNGTITFTGVYEIAGPTPTPTPTDTATPTDTPVPTNTPTPTDTPIPVDTATPTPTPECEGIECVVLHFYDEILGREPGQSELDGWAIGYFDWLMTQDLDVRFVPSEMGRQFFLSDEYLARSTDDVTFITDNYNAFLYRDPGQPEIDGWTPVQNRKEAVSIFSNSAEFQNRVTGMFPDMEGNPTRNFVATMYLGLLDRLPDPGGLAFYADEFNAAGDKRARAKLMGREVIDSQEYADKRTSDELRVESMYRAYLGRYPSNSEIGYWSGLLAEGDITLEGMIDAFADSQEFTNRLNEYF